VAQREGRARKFPTTNAVCFHAQQCAEKYLKRAASGSRPSFSPHAQLPTLLQLVLGSRTRVVRSQSGLEQSEHLRDNFRYPGANASKVMPDRPCRGVGCAQEHASAWDCPSDPLSDGVSQNGAKDFRAPFDGSRPTSGLIRRRFAQTLLPMKQTQMKPTDPDGLFLTTLLALPLVCLPGRRGASQEHGQRGAALRESNTLAGAVIAVASQDKVLGLNGGWSTWPAPADEARRAVLDRFPVQAHDRPPP